MSFRYHATLSPKPHFNKKEFIVEGWSEKELLKTLGDINDRYFTVNVGDGDKVVMDIHFIESLKDYIKVFTSEGDFLAHKSLTSITEELPKSKFLRIHRSFTVSLDKIDALEGNSVLLKGKRIPIGRKYVNHAKDVILNA